MSGGDPAKPRAASAPRPTPTLVIDFISRERRGGEQEVMTFTPGVNVIAGPPNSGKSIWLAFLDFVLGDTGAAVSALGSEVAEAYKSARVQLRIGAPAPALEAHPTLGLVREPTEGAAPGSFTTHVIERRWHDRGLASKILVDGRTLAADEFGAWLLDRLALPTVHFPKGDPFAERAWPLLSWRMTYRQIYRNDRSWSEIAAQQPDSEQLAVLLQFLGIAESLYSAEAGESVRLRREMADLEAQRNALMRLLARVAAEIGGFGDMSVAVTPDTAARSRDRLAEQRSAVEARRDEALADLRADASPTGAQASDAATVERLLDDLASARGDLEVATEAQRRSDTRLRELRTYLSTVRSEQGRLSRARAAGRTLAPLRVTTCPACDRSLSRHAADGHCYLCGREHEQSRDPEAAAERIQFEIRQLANEESELSEVVRRAEVELADVRRGGALASRRVAELEARARPLRSSTAAIMSPRVTDLEQQIGALGERMRTLDGIERLLGERDAITAEIASLDKRAKTLAAAADERASHLDFTSAGETLADGLNTYLSAIGADDPGRWPEGAVAVSLSERQVAMRFGKVKWRAQLGATLRCYFLNAYHYALMSLTTRPGCHYPGLAIVDFPPSLADSTDTASAEAFLVEPFVGMLKRMEPTAAQLIVAGRASLDIPGTNRIVLSKVYR